MRYLKYLIFLPVFFISILSAHILAAGGPPYQATGFKTGEVTPFTAIIWTRLTRKTKRNSPDAPMVELVFEEGKTSLEKEKSKKSKKKKLLGARYPEGMGVEDIRYAAPGIKGEVRVSYKPAGTGKFLMTGWKAVDPEKDFTCQFSLRKLKPGIEYEVLVESRAKERKKPGQPIKGRFKTAPLPDKPAKVVFGVSTGQKFGDQDCKRGYKIYDEMLKLDISFFVHTGDIVYYDKLAKSPGLARYHWQRTYGLPGNVNFHNQVTSYFIKDDHDTWQNDCWPTMDRDTEKKKKPSKEMGTFTFKHGLAIFLEQVPMGRLTYRTRRWGKDLQIWMVEGRDYRSANDAPDGPDKTIWGKEQKEWFKRTVKESDAAFKVLISPTPIVGPDRESKKDNHSNKCFAHEGKELREFIGKQKNMVTVCGDRHWQYISVDPKTGVREYSCGPASDGHSVGYRMSKRKPMHEYLNIVGGFMTCTVERVKNVPVMTFRHYSPEGEVLNKDELRAE